MSEIGSSLLRVLRDPLGLDAFELGAVRLSTALATLPEAEPSKPRGVCATGACTARAVEGLSRGRRCEAGRHVRRSVVTGRAPPVGPFGGPLRGTERRRVPRAFDAQPANASGAGVCACGRISQTTPCKPCRLAGAA